MLDTPAVVAHARLVVIGGDSHRLHEEVIAAGGFIREGRWGGRLNVGQVEAALAGATGEEPSERVRARLLELYPALASSLASALEARMKDRVEGLQKRLAERADKEAGDIESILTELRKAIEAELERPGVHPAVALRRPGDGAVRAEQGGDAGQGAGDPRRDRAGDGGDPGEVRRPAGPDVPGGGDVPGAARQMAGAEQRVDDAHWSGTCSIWTSIGLRRRIERLRERLHDRRR